MSAEARIALIGVVGALAGTLVGGGVTYAVTQDQISSQKVESRRTERLDAYAAYYGDSTRFWLEVFTITEAGEHPKSLTASQRTALNTLAETLTGEFVRLQLLAPTYVRAVAQRLNNVNTIALNALGSGAIQYRDYNQAAQEVTGNRGLIRQFAIAMRRDLGTR